VIILALLLWDNSTGMSDAAGIYVKSADRLLDDDIIFLVTYLCTSRLRILV